MWPLTDLLARLRGPYSDPVRYDTELELEALAQESVRVARTCIGQGEGLRNNEGAFIEKIGGRPGAPWCAAFAGWCYAEAARDMGLVLPFARSSGAKALVKSMGRVGRLFDDPLDARPGDLVAWHRGDEDGWQGHVELVARVEPDGVIHTVAGNVGAFPARVRELTHDVRHERLFSFATLRAG